jgi:hypothetical protein
MESRALFYVGFLNDSHLEAEDLRVQKSVAGQKGAEQLGRERNLHGKGGPKHSEKQHNGINR